MYIMPPPSTNLPLMSAANANPRPDSEIYEMLSAGIPDVDTTLLRLKNLHVELAGAAKVDLPVDEGDSPTDADGNWWKAYPPPGELSLLSGDEPAEIREDVEKLIEQSFYTPPPPESPQAPENVSTLEVVEEGTITNVGTTVSVHSSSGDDSTVNDDDEITEIGSESGRNVGKNRKRLSVLHLRRPSVASARSSSSESSADLASLAPSSTSSGKRSMVQAHRTVKHGVAPVGVLLYSPYYTSSRPNASRPEIPQLVSPRAEAIKKYLNSRKEQSECASCLVDLRVKNLTTLPCQHKYCGPCLRTLINTAANDESLFPPKCCLAEIPYTIISSTLSRSEKANYKSKAGEYAIPWSQRFHCPRPNCGAWIRPSQIEAIVGSAHQFRCTKCRHKLCRYCKGSAHPAGTDCPQDDGLAAVMDVAQQYGWRRCYQCHAMVELVSGCRHMRCRCKAEFCYMCGARWSTCECTGTGYTRAQFTIDHEAELEQAELRAAIAAAEEMERQEEEERRRAEIAARIAAERAAEAERERLERDAEKRKVLVEKELTEIAARYRNLTKAMEGVCVLQEQAMAERHRKEREDLVSSYKNHVQELADLVVTKIAEVEAARETEIEVVAAKHAEEKLSLQTRHEQEEDEYWFSLQTHLKGKPNAKAREQALVDRLRAQQGRELEELMARLRQESLTPLKKVESESWEMLKELEEKKAALEENSRKRDVKKSAMVWAAERRWLIVVDGERKSRLLARMMEEEDSARAKLVVD
ncbi:hypothetical protein FN846DRAFT_810580 [Sphaerosporella brunnea]|uniref:RBR-type E3 ubiquitin transferase n=1 Tax=Sphaerosporella brunnea TaxID=1250544 RepID=A0A5J5F0H1_9PEZI|nr:hypothetical protein FN846DRAFT_810580 [Sphaerosporella brunnea]